MGYGSVEEGCARLVSEASLANSAGEISDGGPSLVASRYERAIALSLVNMRLIAVPIAPICTTGSVRVEKWLGNTAR